MTDWTPGRRKAQLALETPYPGVPAHLSRPLWDWMTGRWTYNTDLLRRIAVEFRYEPADYPSRQLQQMCADDRGFQLDVVEFLLETQCADHIYDRDWEASEYLNHLLASANSIYRVNEDHSGLAEVSEAAVQEVVQATVNDAGGSPGDHLREAWNCAFSRQADPVKSYSESVKAAEAALASRVSPQNGRQTLGTMIRDVAAKPGKWKFAIADGNVGGVDTVLHMMRLLWDGQTSRHGGADPTQSETLDESRAAVHLAAALVQYGVSGAFDLA